MSKTFKIILQVITGLISAVFVNQEIQLYFLNTNCRSFPGSPLTSGGSNCYPASMLQIVAVILVDIVGFAVVFSLTKIILNKIDSKHA